MQLLNAQIKDLVLREKTIPVTVLNQQGKCGTEHINEDSVEIGKSFFLPEQTEINFMKWLDRNQNLILDDIAKFITDPFIADNSKFIKKTDEAIRLIQENKEHRYAELQKKYSGSVKIEANLKNQFVNDNLFDVNTTEKNSNTEPEIDLAKKRQNLLYSPVLTFKAAVNTILARKKKNFLK